MAASEELANVTLGVQQRLSGAWPPMPRRAGDLFIAIKNCLLLASDEKHVKDSPHDIQRKLKLTRDKNTPDTFAIIGGLVDGTRFGKKDPFRRDDGALFDFSIAVRQHAEAVELLAYDFLIELPPGLGPPLLRFDLNRPGQDNEHIGLRSHVHPGVNEDQLIVPAPVMGPVEILTIFLHHLRSAARKRSVRGTFQWDPDVASGYVDLQRRAFRLMSWIKLSGG